MIYYKIIVSFSDSEAEQNSSSEMENRRNARKKAQQIQLQTEDFNTANPDTFFFMSAVLERKCYIGAWSKKAVGSQQIVSYLEYINQKYTDIIFEETTFDSISSMLSTAAQRNQFIEDEEEFLEKFGLDKLTRRHLNFTENVLTASESENALLKKAEESLSSSLKEEIGRIFQHSAGLDFIGHPVHYIIEADSAEVHRKLYEILLRALYHANRLQNRRYAMINISEYSNIRRTSYAQLCRSCIGGAIVLNYIGSDTKDDEFADGLLDDLMMTVEEMKKFRNETLTVICLPKACNKLKDTLFDLTENCTFVEIKEDTVFGDRAKKYLTQQAELRNITPDSTLYQEVLNSQTGFSSSELNNIFENWMGTVLKTKIYPQYAGMKSVKKQLAEKNPQGSAYDELKKMIGLENAKGMIDRALNYYKAQKLFKDKGMQAKHPAMHMVFTGNPGTAKTTVARLFARIMKENGLLSEGKLYEVGRADLVGKYVGWTAQIVKEKFKKAKGSVLFIDEAYSLIDDRSGMFGDEAINTIVQEMENNREDIVVIFAGYPNEMERFLSRNPGLRSRIAFHISFEDYTPDELCGITELITEKNGMTLAPGTREKLLDIFAAAAAQNDFGNGRFARSLVEQAQMKQADRLVAMDCDSVTKDDVATLLPEDFEAFVPSKPRKIEIGFRALV